MLHIQFLLNLKTKRHKWHKAHLTDKLFKYTIGVSETL